MDVLASNTLSKRDSFYRFRSGWLALIATISTLLFILTPLPALPTESPIHFTDVTDTAGIHFEHIDGATGAFHFPETLGAGGAFLDYNNDGYFVLPDLQLNVKVARIFSVPSSVFDRHWKKKNGINLATLVLN